MYRMTISGDSITEIAKVAEVAEKRGLAVEITGETNGKSTARPARAPRKQRVRALSTERRREIAAYYAKHKDIMAIGDICEALGVGKSTVYRCSAEFSGKSK